MYELVKVMIEKFDDRSGERGRAHTNSEKICDKITSHRRPSNPLGQERKEEEEDGEFRTGH